jgi:CheY-like chemotaxis protein
MPVCSGFEATALIRKYEMEHGLSPVPIIALTAHAMIGYRVLFLSIALTCRKNVLRLE